MQGLNSVVIQSACLWLNRGEPVWYVTVINTWGASPRPVGSIFAYNPIIDEVSGSLSGGCVEQDLIEELKQLGDAVVPFKKMYGVDEQERSKFQLPCGGCLELMIEYCGVESSYVEHFVKIERYLLDRTTISRKLSLSSGKMTLSKPSKSSKKFVLDGASMQHVLGPQYRLLIIGVSDIAHYLTTMALMSDFAVTICDPREEFVMRSGLANQFSGQKVDLQQCLPDDLVNERFNDPYSAVLALAHDPRVDDLAIFAALESEAFYVGALGSKKTASKRIERLSSLGMSDSSLANLHAPIGLAIRSKTPSEIAISVIAQLVKERNRHALSLDDSMCA